MMFGAIYYAGGAPAADEWPSIGLLLATTAVILATASQFANAYADRDEDWLYVPSNPLVTGELDAGTARKVLIAQNILCGMLVIALLVVSDFNYPLIIAVVAGWVAGLAYSLPPLRLKETKAGPFTHALAAALVPIAGWLVVERSLIAQDGFIIAFAAFFFVQLIAFNITVKLRKTFEDLNSGRIKVGEGMTVADLRTSGLDIKVKYAVALEAVVGLGAFILVPVYWYLEIFDAELLTALLSLPLAFMVLTAVYRLMDPLKNAYRCALFMAMASVFTVFSLLGVALADVIHPGFVVLIFVFFIGVYMILQKATRPSAPIFSKKGGELIGDN